MIPLKKNLMAYDFVTRMTENSLIRKNAHNVVKEGRMNMAMGFVSVLFGCYLVSKEYFRKPSTNMDELNERIHKVRRTQIMSDMFSGAMLVYTGYGLVNTYIPSNNEVSVAILVQYLQKKGIIDDDRLMDVLKDLKPYRIKGLNIK